MDILANLHLADSNRQAPGDGHFDFASVAEALREVDFKGYCSFEVFGLYPWKLWYDTFEESVEHMGNGIKYARSILDELCCSQIPGHTSGGMERIDIMRRVALVDYGKLVLQDNCGDIKALEPGTVKIDVTACSICGSDIALYRGNVPLRMKDISGTSFRRGSRSWRWRNGIKKVCAWQVSFPGLRTLLELPQRASQLLQEHE